MVKWICAPARSFRTACLISLRLSVQQTDAPRVYQNGEFVGYDSLIREFFVQHSTFQCPELCIRGNSAEIKKKRLSERGWFHAVVSLPMSWQARGLSFPLMFLISFFLQPITIGFPEERGLGNLGGALETFSTVCRVSNGVVFFDGVVSEKLPLFFFRL